MISYKYFINNMNKNQIPSKKLVSIAMATFNGQLYLREQLDSIVAQTYDNLELIIVDDCSTDDTLMLLHSYKKKYENIKIFQNKINLGVVKSFEKAINLCSGDFIALSDQDDVWFSNKIAILVAQIGDNWLIHSDSTLVDEQLNVLQESHFKCGKQSNKVDFFDYLINVNVTGCTAMVSRQLLNIALPFKTYYLPHDWYLTYYAAYCSKIKLINIPLIYYRQHTLNVSGAKKKNFDQYIKSNISIGLGLNELMNDLYFQGCIELQLMTNYKLSLSNRKLIKFINIIRLIMKKKRGIKLIIFYLLMVLPPKNISKILYNAIRKLI